MCPFRVNKYVRYYTTIYEYSFNDEPIRTLRAAWHKLIDRVAHGPAALKLVQIILDPIGDDLVLGPVAEWLWIWTRHWIRFAYRFPIATTRRAIAKFRGK